MWRISRFQAKKNARFLPQNVIVSIITLNSIQVALSPIAAASELERKTLSRHMRRKSGFARDANICNMWWQPKKNFEQDLWFRIVRPILVSMMCMISVEPPVLKGGEGGRSMNQIRRWRVKEIKVTGVKYDQSVFGQTSTALTCKIVSDPPFMILPSV